MDKRNIKDRDIENKVTGFFLLVSLIALVALVVTWQGYKASEVEYAEKKELSKQIKTSNEEVETLITNQNDKLNLSNVKKQSEQFYNLFFNWNSWQKYTSNMLEIQKEFPQLEKNTSIDITGNMVGTGTSPISSYDVKYYINGEKGKVLAVIVQLRNTATSTKTTIWRGVTHVNNENLFYVDELDPYSRLD